MNPWVSMWTRPRTTIQQIVDENPEHYVWVLAALAGIGRVLDRASIRNMGDRVEFPLILLLALVAGPIGGLVSLYIGSALIRWTGNWMSGKASSGEVRTAVAWSSLPMVVGLLLWVLQLAIFGQEMFTAETPRIDANPFLVFVGLGFAGIEMVLVVWAVVLFAKEPGPGSRILRLEGPRQCPAGASGCVRSRGAVRLLGGRFGSIAQSVKRPVVQLLARDPVLQYGGEP